MFYARLHTSEESKSKCGRANTSLIRHIHIRDKGVDIFTCIFEQAGYYALKVPDSVFMDMKNAQVEDLDRMLQNEHSAMKVLLRYIDEWVSHVD